MCQGEESEITIDCLEESTCRSEWHKAIREHGLENCKVCRIDVAGGGFFFRITITASTNS